MSHGSVDSLGSARGGVASSSGTPRSAHDSARRGRTILGFLKEDGVSEVELSRVHVPIGLDIGARSYGSIQSILKHGLDRRPPQPAKQGELLPDHPNIRGPRYYH